MNPGPAKDYKKEQPRLSIVSTLFCSAPYIEEFCRRASHAASSLVGDDYEIVLVNDGSPDNSLEIAVSLHKQYPQHIVVVDLSRNFGHHKAMMTGLAHASGKKIFLIDSDLEEEPEWLAPFAEQMEKEQCDVVYGYQTKRNGDFVKKSLGNLGWFFIQRLSSVKIKKNLCTVRLMTRRYVDALCLHKETCTAIGGLWVLTGFEQKGLPVEKKCREKSSYTFYHRIKMLVESITSFSEAPLYFVLHLGLIIFLMSLAVATFLVFRRIRGVVLDGWVSVMVSVWGLGGLILLSLGIIGLYVARIFLETKNRPYTIVRNIYKFFEQPYS